MTRREKWLQKVPDRYIEATICDTGRHLKDDCPDCPIKDICFGKAFGADADYEKYMAAISRWLDEEVEE